MNDKDKSVEKCKKGLFLGVPEGAGRGGSGGRISRFFVGFEENGAQISKTILKSSSHFQKLTAFLKSGMKSGLILRFGQARWVRMRESWGKMGEERGR